MEIFEWGETPVWVNPLAGYTPPADSPITTLPLGWTLPPETIVPFQTTEQIIVQQAEGRVVVETMEEAGVVFYPDPTVIERREIIEAADAARDTDPNAPVPWDTGNWAPAGAGDVITPDMIRAATLKQNTLPTPDTSQLSMSDKIDLILLLALKGGGYV
jgi:hypothetical protein